MISAPFRDRLTTPAQPDRNSQTETTRQKQPDRNNKQGARLNTWLEIDRKALLSNFRIFEGIAGTGKILPVVKSNAYGHGLEIVVRCLWDHGCKSFAVNDLDEAAAIRDFGFDGRIVVMGPILPQDIDAALGIRAEIFLGGEEVLERWLALPNRPKAHVKFDTGMSRQGFRPDKAEFVADRLAAAGADLVGAATHLADVEDVLDHRYALDQLAGFGIARKALKSRGIRGIQYHAASSASCMLLPESRMDLCRIGISLYGLWPSKATRLSYLNEQGTVPNLAPVLSWKCRLAYIQTVEKGQYVGYGCTFRANRRTQVGVLPVGYNEGYHRIAGESQSYVLIQGQRCPILGRICMNMLMVDVSHLPSAGPGDTATLIGTDDSETLGADSLAEWARTINYEVVTCLNPSLERRPQ